MEIKPVPFIDSNPKITAFRKIISMSRESDMLYGTNTIEQWKSVVDTETDLIAIVAKAAYSEYEKSVDDLRKKYDNPSVPFEAKQESLEKLEKEREKLKKKLERTYKALERRKNKLEKFNGIIEKLGG